MELKTACGPTGQAQRLRAGLWWQESPKLVAAGSPDAGRDAVTREVGSDAPRLIRAIC